MMAGMGDEIRIEVLAVSVEPHSKGIMTVHCTTERRGDGEVRIPLRARRIEITAEGIVVSPNAEGWIGAPTGDLYDGAPWGAHAVLTFAPGAEGR